MEYAFQLVSAANLTWLSWLAVRLAAYALLGVVALLAALFIPWTIYNLFFSPLRHIPGPISAIIFPYQALQSYFVRNDVPKYIRSLHNQYGPVVRILPFSVVVDTIALHKTIYSSHSFIKHRLYDGFAFGSPQTFNTRDPELSKRRKRQLTPTFAPPSVSAMEPLIRARGVGSIAKRWMVLLNAAAAATAAAMPSSSEEVGSDAVGVTVGSDTFGVAVGMDAKESSPGLIQVDLYTEFMALTASVITRLAFGESVEMINTETGELHPMVTWIKSLNTVIYWFVAFPKTIRGLMTWIWPQHVQNVSSILEWSRERIKHNLGRARIEDGHADIPQMFMDAVDPETGEKLDNDSLQAEASVMLVAGSDTTAFTLIWTFDLLFQHPQVFRKLEAEILEHFPSKDAPILFKDAKDLPYLDAVIVESMRVRAVAGQLIPRVVPAGGRVLAGHFIPGGYGVGASVESVHRDPSVFDSPTQFIPERFVEGTPEEISFRRQHVIPFSVGVRSCLGRQLALAEMYTTVPTLIRQFEIRPAEQPYPPRTEQSLFLLAPKEKSLPAIISPRNH